MSFRKKLISYPIALAMMMITSTAMAKIPPIAFKHITRHFRSGKEAYSPVLGETALETGLVENLRFFGPFTPGYNPDGTRNYVEDTSTDPLWNVVKIFFPSFSGSFGLESQGSTNFGRYVNSPKTVALLLGYANQVREKLTPNDEDFISQIVSSLNIEKKDIKNFKKKALIPLLKNIKFAIIQEQAKGSLYPQFTTEQIIEAFFCYKFNTQDDIQDLIKALPDHIVDKSIPFTQQREDLLTENDLKIIAAQSGNLDLDDVFALANASIFTAIIPYREGITPLSNGNCWYYDRQLDQFINPKKTFADCVEIAGRHIANMIIYNPEIRGFDLSFITEWKKNIPAGSPAEQRINEVINFYNKQPVNLANSGDITIRSAWNRVIGDLNAFQDGSPTVKYVQGGNELDSGIINFIYAFQKIFSLPIIPFPDETSPQRDKEKWVQSSFEILFRTLNPTHAYQIDPSDLEWDKNKQDFFGSMKITVSDDISKTDLFSFLLKSSKDHSEIKDLKILKKSSTQKEVDKALGTQLTTIHPDTAEDSLWLLAPSSINKVLNENLYNLFPKALADNTSKLTFIYRLNYLIRESQLTEGIIPASLMLGNVLTTISWADINILGYITDAIRDVFKNRNLTEILKETLFKNIQGLSLHGSEEEQKFIDKNFSKFQNLKIIQFYGDALKFNPIHASLEIVDLHTSDIEELPGIGYLKKLKKLNLTNTTLLKNLSFSENNSTLEEVNFSESAIENVVGISFLKELKAFIGNGCRNLKTLEFSIKNENLEELKLSNSGVEEVVGMNHLKNLQKLFLKTTPNLKHLAFSPENSSLTELDLFQSNIEELIHVDCLKSLKNLNASLTPNLKNLAFSENNSALERLNFSQSGIEKVTGMSFLNGLKTLVGSGCFNLRTLEFSENNSALEEMDFSKSAIERVAGISFLKRLKTFDGDGCFNLRTLEFSINNDNLENLRLNSSGIEELVGVDLLKGLKILLLQDTSLLKRLTFSPYNSSLTKLDLFQSNIEELIGIDSLKGLQKLLLGSTPNLKTLSFSQDNSTLEELTLNHSGIAQLTGVNHLHGLKELNAEKTTHLKSITFTEENVNLQKLYLTKSSIEELIGIDSLKGLQKLLLDHTTNLKTLSFSQNNSTLKELTLDHSGITQLIGVSHLHELKELKAEKTTHLKSITFTEENASLQKLYLKKSSIEELSGLSLLKNLKLLDVKGCDKLKEIKVSKNVKVRGFPKDKIKWIEDEVDG